jgi:hypothetical protein
MPAKTPTPWGPATVVEEIKVAQRAGERRFTSTFQLLENEQGEPLLRIAYMTAGITRRGPVTLRPRDLEKLRASLGKQSSLGQLLGWAGGGA